MLLVGLSLNVIHLLGYAVVGWTPHKIIVWVLEMMAALVLFSNVATTALVSKNVPKDEQGTALGIVASSSNIVSAIGPGISTFLYVTFRGDPYNLPQAPFFFGAMLSGISVFIACKFLPRVLARNAKREPQLKSYVSEARESYRGR